MKKIISLLCILFLFVCGFTACTNGNMNGNTGNDTTQDQTTDSDDKNNDDTNKGDTDMTINNILIAYFSCTNNTKSIAEKIATATDGTLYQIIPAVPYTSADLNYNTDCRANREQNDESCRPEITGNVDNMKNFDTVFIGYPIWWGQAPKIIYTFLESYDFSGKTIIPFCTSGSSGIGSSDTNLHSLTSNSDWKNGKRFSNSASSAEIKDWIDGLKMDENKEITKLHITIGETVLSATLVENSSVTALVNELKKSPITIEMHDYGNFEKVGSLGFNLPRNDEQITTTPGDIILYQGNQITIYYDTNSWNFTRLGKIENITKSELLSILGKGNVTVTLSLSKL